MMSTFCFDIFVEIAPYSYNLQMFKDTFICLQKTTVQIGEFLPKDDLHCFVKEIQLHFFYRGKDVVLRV